MNSKKGISMVMVIVMVAVLIVISFTVVISGSGVMEKTKLKQYGTEMLQVKEATNQYVKRNSGNIQWETTKISVNSMTAEEKEQYFEEDLTQDLNLYIVNLKDIGAESLRYGTANSLASKDIYLYSKETKNIYYNKGYKYKDKIYYTLTDELMDMIK